MEFNSSNPFLLPSPSSPPLRPPSPFPFPSPSVTLMELSSLKWPHRSSSLPPVPFVFRPTTTIASFISRPPSQPQPSIIADLLPSAPPNFATTHGSSNHHQSSPIFLTLTTIASSNPNSLRLHPTQITTFSSHRRHPRNPLTHLAKRPPLNPSLASPLVATITQSNPLYP